MKLHSIGFEPTMGKNTIISQQRGSEERKKNCWGIIRYKRVFYFLLIAGKCGAEIKESACFSAKGCTEQAGEFKQTFN